MVRGRDNGWDDNIETYTPGQVESVLEHCGINIEGETNSHFLCLCPFHGNTDSPAFAVDKTKGKFHCFNPSCEASGELTDILQRTQSMTMFQALRTIVKYKNVSSKPFNERLASVMTKAPEFVEFPQSVIDKMRESFPGSVAEEYMHSRGFDDNTLTYFEVGYSANKNMVAVPMHDPKGMPVGVIGRTPSHTDKSFKNSVNLPKSKTAWNFHRAKRTGETVIVCEASYDAMRIHQAGYPNVIALLGGHVTDYHIDQIGKHFSTVIIMTDFDPKQYRPNCRLCDYKKCQGHRPGRVLGHSIARKLPNKRVLWAVYDDSCVLPRGAKDASDLTSEEIRQCLKGAVSNVAYVNGDYEKDFEDSLAH